MTGRWQRIGDIDLSADIHGRALDFVSDTDRAWFAAHPGEDSYLRSAGEHEFCDPRVVGTGRCKSLLDVPEGVEVIVLVTRVAEGIRTRRPVYWIFKPRSVA